MQQDRTEPRINNAFAMPEPVAPLDSRRRFGTVAAFVTVALIGVLFLMIIWPRMQAGKAIAEIHKDTRPLVVVIPAQRAKASTELNLPGTMLPIQEAPLYARTNGYVKR